MHLGGMPLIILFPRLWRGGGRGVVGGGGAAPVRRIIIT